MYPYLDPQEWQSKASTSKPFYMIKKSLLLSPLKNSITSIWIYREKKNKNTYTYFTSVVSMTLSNHDSIFYICINNLAQEEFLYVENIIKEK